MIESIKNGDLDGIFASTGNVLESVTLEKNPQVKRIKDRMLAFGAEAALMSGSGPTVFALIKQYSEQNVSITACVAFVRKFIWLDHGVKARTIQI